MQVTSVQLFFFSKPHKLFYFNFGFCIGITFLGRIDTEISHGIFIVNIFFHRSVKDIDEDDVDDALSSDA